MSTPTEVKDPAEIDPMAVILHGITSLNGWRKRMRDEYAATDLMIAASLEAFTTAHEAAGMNDEDEDDDP